MSKGKFGAYIARAAKRSLHLVAKWHGCGRDGWRVVYAKEERKANERIACLLGKRKLAGSISHMKRSENRNNCKDEKRT